MRAVLAGGAPCNGGEAVGPDCPGLTLVMTLGSQAPAAHPKGRPLIEPPSELSGGCNELVLTERKTVPGTL